MLICRSLHRALHLDPPEFLIDWSFSYLPFYWGFSFMYSGLIGCVPGHFHATNLHMLSRQGYLIAFSVAGCCKRRYCYFCLKWRNWGSDHFKDLFLGPNSCWAAHREAKSGYSWIYHCVGCILPLPLFLYLYCFFSREMCCPASIIANL